VRDDRNISDFVHKPFVKEGAKVQKNIMVVSNALRLTASDGYSICLKKFSFLSFFPNFEVKSS
jgi:hypothetical protein